jgi:uncharacterized protein (TIGR03437 family)
LPGIFTLDESGSAPAAAHNQDMNLNTIDHAAKVGTDLVLYLTEEVPDKSAISLEIGDSRVYPRRCHADSE